MVSSATRPIGELAPDSRTGETSFKRRWYHPDGTATQPTFSSEVWQREAMEKKGFRLQCTECAAQHGYHKADCSALPKDPWKLVEPGSGQIRLCLLCGKVQPGHDAHCRTLRGEPESYETRGSFPEVDMDALKEIALLKDQVARLTASGEDYSPAQRRGKEK